MDKAEYLFARHGFDGISLREIAIAAGQSNNNVVQYHFQDKAGLVRAILNNRATRAESFRHESFEKLPQDERTDPYELLKILWGGQRSIRSADGSHTYCHFFLQYLFLPQMTQHPIFSSIEGDSTAGANSAAELNFPYTLQIARTLDIAFPHLPRSVYAHRMTMLGMMFLSSVVVHDNSFTRLGALVDSFDLEPSVKVAMAALNAPA